MPSNYSKSLYNDYEKVIEQNEELKKLVKDLNKTISELNKAVNSLNESLGKMSKENEELKQEILRLKINNDKDSSNSSKPSGTNGYKKVITNRREKSELNKGGQKGHKAHSINNKLDQFINSGDVEEKIVEINKNRKNKNRKYIEKVVIDIKVTKTVTRYRYYPDKNGEYNIPKEHNQKIQYGPNIKTICVDLMTNLYNSGDGTTRFIEDITNGGMTISKGTLNLWLNQISQNLLPEIVKIEASLLDSYYINHDESQIKINGEGYNILCACNKKYTRLWIHKHKSHDALEEIGFLPKYKGIIVKDGTDLYNKFGVAHAQCISHILRYLVNYYTSIPTKHKMSKEMSDFLSNCNVKRNKLKEKGISNFSVEEYDEIINEYDRIINEWEKEIREDNTNPLIEDETKLWTRMKYDNKQMDKKISGDREQILYFLKDFNIPFTNNQAETDQRNAKIKQKTGKWRSIEGTESYTIIRSCINTYKKNDINVFSALKQSFLGNTILV